MRAGRRTLSEKAILMDVLRTLRSEAVLDGQALTVCRRPSLRRVISAMAAERIEMYDRLCDLAARRGWLWEPRADGRLAEDLGFRARRSAVTYADPQADAP